MVSLTNVIRRRSPYLRRRASASENLTPSKDQANFSIWPVRCSSMVRPGSRPSGSMNVLRRSAYVRTRRPLLRRPIPGSSNLGVGLIVCMSTKGLLVSEAG
ncbi:hypothetical protein WR25_24972 [Diploscapter pachys]|uniref:Uncharacterized protein n=1 Tax=Diploscapter pachys TaxID=2018661 RepID=A0A2A2M5S7_9BILA|nr:hypothetical protein WR25_24972 [Diploscapter pachys]